MEPDLDAGSRHRAIAAACDDRGQGYGRFRARHNDANGAFELGRQYHCQPRKQFASQSPVPVAVSASGNPLMRFIVDGVHDSRGWIPWVSHTVVPISGADGTKTIECVLSFDGGSTCTTETDTVKLDSTAPLVSIASPVSSGNPADTVTGACPDSGSGTRSVRLEITSIDGGGSRYYWDGSVWTPNQLSCEATLSADKWSLAL